FFSLETYPTTLYSLTSIKIVEGNLRLTLTDSIIEFFSSFLFNFFELIVHILVFLLRFVLSIIVSSVSIVFPLTSNFFTLLNVDCRSEEHMSELQSRFYLVFC